MVLGGVGSELTGGNFWQGALIGVVVAGLNHAMHLDDNFNDGDDDKYKIQKKKVRIQLLRDNIESLKDIDS